MSDQAIPYTELWRDGECSFILAREDFHRLVGDTQRLARFRTLWTAYRQSLSQPFGKNREEDGQITARIDSAFDALDQLSKEVS